MTGFDPVIAQESLIGRNLIDGIALASDWFDFAAGGACPDPASGRL